MGRGQMGLSLGQIPVPDPEQVLGPIELIKKAIPTLLCSDEARTLIVRGYLCPRGWVGRRRSTGFLVRSAGPGRRIRRVRHGPSLPFVLRTAAQT